MITPVVEGFALVSVREHRVRSPRAAASRALSGLAHDLFNWRFDVDFQRTFDPSWCSGSPR